MIATNMRDDMLAEGRDDEMEALVRSACAPQDELTDASGDRRRPNGDIRILPRPAGRVLSRPLQRT